jgi:hypothetical protein
MVPWELAAAALVVGALAGFGLRVLIDYSELLAYRRIARKAAEAARDAPR